jgi:hypothetical protein
MQKAKVWGEDPVTSAEQSSVLDSPRGILPHKTLILFETRQLGSIQLKIVATSLVRMSARVRRFAPQKINPGKGMTRPQPEIGTSHPNRKIPNLFTPVSAAGAHEPINNGVVRNVGNCRT